MSVEESDGVASIIPSEDRSFGIKLKCASCREVSQKYIYIDPSEIVETKGGGIRQMATKCAFCSAQISGNIVSCGKYVCDDDENSENGNNNKNDGIIFTLDIRNGEPEELELDDQWVVMAKGGTKFEHVDLSEDWCSFDEAKQQVVALSGVTVSFRKVK